ncbi:MAG: FCD domain-containing protein, partial [Rhodocyclales bacterium]|nr:FCD domain-containing protein [Rhodocyclales bacterium]
RLEQSLTEHGALLAALLERNPQLAEQRMREHINSGRAALARIAASRSRKPALADPALQ